MKFSEQWLREWVQPEASTQELVDQITMAGLEVDDVEAVASDFSGVVVGQVVSREQHPDADKLSLCQVTDGNETFQIVCGAANVREGLKIPFAKIGASLPGAEADKPFKIKKAKLRGVESFGMLCAEAELGMAESSDGLMELPVSAPVGADLREYLGLDDSIIDVDLTPNRGDCLSIAGLARETGVLFHADVQGPDIQPVIPAIDDLANIEVLDAQACPRYLGRLVKGVNLDAETPLWMVEKLRRSGIRSIDPVVDVTNYVLLELGQPMHAFDLNQIAGGIRVRKADAGEKLVLLDGQEVELSVDTLVVADHEKPLAIAGVMGGESSGVNTETQDLLLEAAFFDQIAIAGKARSYGLHTDSSHRFERGVDFDQTRRAMERATQLIIEICGGQAGPVVEVSSEEYLPQRVEIRLRKARIEMILGLTMADADVEEILVRLGLQLVTQDEDGWTVKAPSYRFDMAIESDLIEELARIYGYNRLPVRTPVAATPLAKTPEARFPLNDIREQLVALGYHEAITYSFVDPAIQQQIDPDREAMALMNPISSEMSVMRTSLWAGLVQAANYNLKRQQSRVRLFETGLRFLPTEDGLEQKPTLAMLATGSRLSTGWANEDAAIDFFDIKGNLEALLSRVGLLKCAQFRADSLPVLHPGQSARIEVTLNGEKRLLGWIGALHPSAQKNLDIKQTLYLVELDLEVLQTTDVPTFTDLSKFPEMHRDLAILVEQDIAVESVTEIIREAAGDYLIKLKLFDVYVGKGIDPDRKSLALGLTWQHPSRTLNEQEVNDAVAAVLSNLDVRLGATLRG
jgi:phenylalanyl-tRNA synthetase beta chain